MQTISDNDRDQVPWQTLGVTPEEMRFIMQQRDEERGRKRLAVMEQRHPIMEAALASAITAISCAEQDPGTTREEATYRIQEVYLMLHQVLEENLLAWNAHR